MKSSSRIQRREFLQRSLAGAGALAWQGTFAAEAPRRVDPFGEVRLGKTDLKLSRICMGTGVRGGNRQSNHTRMGREKCEALIRGAYERGVRTFDLADMYGTHPYVIPALRDIPREKFAVITKIWFRPGGIPEKERPDPDVLVKRFLDELKTDYIDLLLLHCVESAAWPKELERQMEMMAKLKQKGVIRAHGLSCHSLVALEKAIDVPWVDSVHARINPYGTRMDGPAEKVAPVLQKLHAAGKGVVGMKLIGEGEFRNSEEKRDHSVQYVLGLGCVDILNVGFEKTEEIDDFAGRVRKAKVA